MSSPAPSYSPLQNGVVGFVEDWERSADSADHGNVSPATPHFSKKHSNVASSPLSEHPDIRSPGLEAKYEDDQEGKEVVEPRPQSYAFYADEKYPQAVDPDQPRKRRRICGMSLTLCLILLLLLLVALGVGLGVGLGLGLKHKSRGMRPANGNPVNPKYLSKTGAFNGTGLAIASSSFGVGGYGIINVYFQHWTGQIRKLQLNTDGSWTGGDASTIVATDARNATPLSAVAYAMDKKSTWHIFYIDKNNIIREKINDNSTNQWRDGPIGDLNLVAMNDTNVGLQACWYGSFYGDADYVHSPIPETGSNTTSKDAVIGMHLWYGESPQSLQEVTWTYNTTEWYRQEGFIANGHAGIACYSWGPGSVSYMMNVDLNNELKIAWKDLNSSVAATDAHPVNQWVNTTISVPNLMPNTSLGYTNYLYAQQLNGQIAGYNISWNAEKTKLGDSFTLPERPLAGTHFSVTAIPNASGGDSLIVFNQQNGTDITENLRDLSSGQWGYAELSIPQM